MSSPESDFVHLHVHTEYSLVDGLLRVEDYVDALVDKGMWSAAVTELYNVFSMIKFYRRCLDKGVKPIIGAEINLADGQGDNRDHRLTLLCQDRQGFRNLTELITLSFTQGQQRGVPVVRRDWLQAHSEGLIALSGARNGAIGQYLLSNQPELARLELDYLQRLFPTRFYLELQRTERQDEDLCNAETLALATEFDAPVVATNDVRFLQPDDFEAHEARVCIHGSYVLNDTRRPRPYSSEQYLKSPEQMAELFQDLPEALQNSVNIAMRCNLELQFGDYHLPEFPVPEGFDQTGWLRREAETGLERLLGEQRPGGRNIDPEQYRRRLDLELDVIISMGFPGYFLIVADFIHWAKQQDIPVGPGRGSGGGSLVAYVLGITDLDPIEHELLFERFLNPERISMPDFDVDFCMERRDEVIEYVAERYGRERVSQIITFGKMAAKAVVRDDGRVLWHPYGFVDKIAKLIPFRLDMTLDQALAEEELLKARYNEEEEVRILIELAKKLEGLVRNVGKHAGGIVISPRALTEYMPLYCERDTKVTSTQFNMGDVEEIGLVKFDFLGLRTLTIIDWAVKDINALLREQDAARLDIRAIPLNDAATYATIRRMNTAAVFQLESDGMKRIIKQLEPDRFDDLVALVALYRPGPLESGMIDDYTDVKKGKAPAKYLHPALETVLKPTYGVIVYQEQVMQIAQILGGYTLGAADLLRRAMGKKKPEEMSRQRDIFVSGALKNEVSEPVATAIFNLMEKFAGYGFNKSHSVAYALLAYQTAWLKTHYPAAFMAAELSADMNNTDRIVRLREELRRMKLVLKPPSINASEYKFRVVDAKTILFGLGAIKGVGQAAIRSLTEQRQAQGRYADLFEFCRRSDPIRVNKSLIEALIRAGALDDFGKTRSVLMTSLDSALRFAQQYLGNEDSGQDDLFGLEVAAASTERADGTEIPYMEAPDWDDHERLRGEKQTLGFYLQGHPIERYADELSSIISITLNKLRPGQSLTVAGYIESVRVRSHRKSRLAEVVLDDGTANAQLTVYSENYQRYHGLLQKDQLVIVQGEAREDRYSDAGASIVVREIHTLEQLRERFAVLRLKVRGAMDNSFVPALREILSRHGSGTNQVSMEYNNDNISTVLSFGSDWNVKISDELLVELGALVGADNIRMAFPERVRL